MKEVSGKKGDNRSGQLHLDLLLAIYQQHVMWSRLHLLSLFLHFCQAYDV